MEGAWERRRGTRGLFFFLLAKLTQFPDSHPFTPEPVYHDLEQSFARIIARRSLPRILFVTEHRDRRETRKFKIAECGKSQKGLSRNVQFPLDAKLRNFW